MKCNVLSKPVIRFIHCNRQNRPYRCHCCDLALSCLASGRRPSDPPEGNIASLSRELVRAKLAEAEAVKKLRASAR